MLFIYLEVSCLVLEFGSVDTGRKEACWGERSEARDGGKVLARKESLPATSRQRRFQRLTV